MKVELRKTGKSVPYSFPEGGENPLHASHEMSRAAIDKLSEALQSNILQGITYNKDRIPVPAHWWSDKAHVASGQIISDGTIVMVPESEVEDWLNKECGLAKQRGRKRGDGKINDDALIDEMYNLILSGRAKSPWDATLSVVDRAAGAGTDQSIRQRLLQNYKEKYSD